MMYCVMEHPGIDSQNMLAMTLPCIVMLICKIKHLNHLLFVPRLPALTIFRGYLFLCVAEDKYVSLFSLSNNEFKRSSVVFLCVCEFPWFVYFLFLFTSFQSNQMSQGSGCQE